MACLVRRTARIRRQRWAVDKLTCARLQTPSKCFIRTKTETHDGRKHRETNRSTERTHIEEKGRGRRSWRQTKDITNRIKSCHLPYCSANTNTDHEHCKTRTRNRCRVQGDCPYCDDCQSHQNTTCSECGRETSTGSEHRQHIYTHHCTCSQKRRIRRDSSKSCGRTTGGEGSRRRQYCPQASREAIKKRKGAPTSVTRSSRQTEAEGRTSSQGQTGSTSC
jgi:hypothetical protein